MNKLEHFGPTVLALAVGALAILGAATTQAQQAPAPPFAQAPSAEDPFAQSQLSEAVFAAPALVVVRGFVDVGYLRISQVAPTDDGGDLSWVYGNSQFVFFSTSETFTVNEIDLTLEGEKETGSLLVGARASIDYYPSFDSEAYAVGAFPSSDVDEAFVFLEWPRAWNTRLVLGRAPGFVTLEQQESEAPDFRLIGHSYVFQAGGGYPYGFQIITRPGSLAVKLGYANGGVGAYSFSPGDGSTLNRSVARDEDRGQAAAKDKVSGFTTYGALEWVPFDQPAGAGTLRVGAAAAHSPELTYNSDTRQPESFNFANFYLGYRFGAVELRLERARLAAFYEQVLGKFDADMGYVLLSWFLGANHLFTLRGEQITFTTGLRPLTESEAVKFGLAYRYRVSDGMAIKAEAVTEEQTPQFFVATKGKDLTTKVVSTSWVYSF